MSKAKRARSAATESKADEKKRLLLDQLKEIAAAVGVEVREERLVREVGYAVHSGVCRIGGRDVVLLDSGAELGELVEAMLDFLAGRDLDAVYIEPQLREMISRRAPKEPRSAEG
jgi:hypothetical protein